jgi:hypothetical protein
MHRSHLVGLMAAACLVSPSICSMAAEGADSGGGGGGGDADAKAKTYDEAALKKAVDAAVAEATKALKSDHKVELAKVQADAKAAVDAAVAEATRLSDLVAGFEKAAAEAGAAAVSAVAGETTLGLAKIAHTEGATSASYGGHTYEADKKGVITVPLEAVSTLVAHGFHLLD